MCWNLSQNTFLYVKERIRACFLLILFRLSFLFRGVSASSLSKRTGMTFKIERLTTGGPTKPRYGGLDGGESCRAVSLSTCNAKDHSLKPILLLFQSTLYLTSVTPIPAIITMRGNRKSVKTYSRTVLSWDDES